MQLNQKLAIAVSSDEVTAPVSMGGGNHAHFEIFLYSGSVKVKVEASNDGENWVVPTSGQSPAATSTHAIVGVNIVDQSSVTFAYLRLRYEGVSAGVLGCNVHVSEQ